MGVLDGRAVVITGAGRGLGEAYARHAGGEGARVVVNDVDAAAAERGAASIRAAGGEAVPAPADVSLQPAAAGLVELCVRRYGAIDGLINNAGVAPLGL